MIRVIVTVIIIRMRILGMIVVVINPVIAIAIIITEIIIIVVAVSNCNSYGCKLLESRLTRPRCSRYASWLMNGRPSAMAGFNIAPPHSEVGEK